MIYNGGKYNEKWDTKKLSDLGDFSRGVSKHRPRNDTILFQNGKYPLVQTGDIKQANLYVKEHSQEYSEAGLKQSKLWKKGTLCITIAANIAETAILDYPMCFPDSIVGFNAFENESSELFMYYIFEYISNSIQNAASGSIQDNINIDYLTSLEFKIPDILYQNKIVKILSLLDKTIINNQKINDNLWYQANSLFDYWFKQYDFPNNEGQPYKSTGGAMNWNEEIQDYIPKNWTCGNLYDIADFINGLACQKYRPKANEDSLPVIKIREMHDGITVDTEAVSASIPDKNILANGDILFSWSATLEVMYWFGGKAGLNQHIFKVNPIKVFPKEYVYHQLSDYVFKFVKMAEARKTTMGHITTDHIRQSRIVIPPVDLLKQFSTIAFPIHEKIGQCNIENIKMTSLRDWLLPMLMNGQATIED